MTIALTVAFLTVAQAADVQPVQRSVLAEAAAETPTAAPRVIRLVPNPPVARTAATAPAAEVRSPPPARAAVAAAPVAAPSRLIAQAQPIQAPSAHVARTSASPASASSPPATAAAPVRLARHEPAPPPSRRRWIGRSEPSVVVSARDVVMRQLSQPAPARVFQSALLSGAEASGIQAKAVTRSGALLTATSAPTTSIGMRVR